MAKGNVFRGRAHILMLDSLVLVHPFVGKAEWIESICVDVILLIMVAGYSSSSNYGASRNESSVGQGNIFHRLAYH